MSEEAITIHRDDEIEAEVPAELKEKAEHFTDGYVAFLKERTEAHMHRVAEAETRAMTEAAAPVLAGGYQYWNCLTVGPIQFFRNPPYRPSKIVAADEWSLMLGVIWVNPANGPGGSLPGTVVLGGRRYHANFETINLTDVTNGPDRHFHRQFDNPAEQIRVLRWWHRWPDPGQHPKLYETTLTVDIVEAGQPMAAFSTWHYDPDREPGFLVDLRSLPDRYGIPDWLRLWTVSPHLQFERPARFLVYQE